MKIDQSKLEFLLLNGFKKENEGTSNFFGDYYHIYSGLNISIRLSSSMSIENIDVKNSVTNNGVWYDLPLLQALMARKKTLNTPIPIADQIEFLKNNLLDISQLFDEDKYLETKRRLDELGRLRARQMFGGTSGM